MIVRITVLFLILFLTACSRTQGTEADKGRLYSYVDAQGNLVTLERGTEESAGRADAPATRARSAGQAPADPDQAAAGTTDEGAGPGEETYQTTEEVEKKLEKLERDRFVSYVGPEGEVINRPLDLVAEREAKEAEPAPYQELQAPEEYLETLTRVPADCCRHLMEEAIVLEPGNEKQLRFGAGYRHWITLDQPRPAVAVELEPGIQSLLVQSYVHNEAYLSPRMLLLDASGRPVLKVDNVFTRRYPENWHRFGYFEGVLPLAEEHAYVVFYLPYGLAEGEGMKVDAAVDGVIEAGARPALEGELVVRGHEGRRSTPGNQSPE